MASPCAASSCAVVLSFLKQRDIPYTSDLVRRALENSARPLGLSSLSGKDMKKKSTAFAFSASEKLADDLVFASGHGSINVGLACSMLETMNSITSSSPFSNLKRGEVAAAVCSRGESEAPRPPELWRYCVTVGTIAPLAARKNVASLAGGGNLGGTRGVYLRGMEETGSVQRMTVNLKAVRDDEKKMASNKAALSAIETTVILSASEKWVSVPASVLLYGSGRDFPISVDPTGLQSGRAHFARIEGAIESASKEGKSMHTRIFSLPVTVVVPESTLPGVSMVKPVGSFGLSSGEVKRLFYMPPLGATYGLLRVAVDSPMKGTPASEAIVSNGTGDAPDGLSDVTSFTSDTGRHGNKSLASTDPEDGVGTVGDGNNDDSLPSSLSAESRLMDVHIVQVESRLPTKHTETKQPITLVPGATKEVLFQVQGGVTVEICLGQRWSSMGSSRIRSVDVFFCGLKPEPSSLFMSPGATCFPRLDVTNALPGGASSALAAHGNPHVVSTFHPKASLSSVHRAIPPFFSEISLLNPDRDELPGNVILSQLVLEYEFCVEDSTSVSVTFPGGLNGFVYDGLVEGGPFVSIHDANKQLLAISDIYPAKTSLGKGTYYARAFVRHGRVSVLEKLKDTCAVVVYTLETAVSLDCFDTAQGAALGGEILSGMKGKESKHWKGLLEPGEKRSVFFGRPSSIPKWVATGDTLVGE